MRLLNLNKGIVAAGMLVGIMLVAGIMRIRFYFDPPEDRFTNQVQAILSEPIELPELNEININQGSLNLPTITSVTPTILTAAQYSESTAHALGEGLVLQLESLEDGAQALVLKGNQLLARTFNNQWEQTSEQVVREPVSLVGGVVPVAKLISTASGYQLVLQQPDGLALYTYNQDLELQSGGVLLVTTVTPSILRVAVQDTKLWILIDEQLQQYDLATDGLLTTQVVPDAPCDLIADSSGAIIVTQSAQTILFNKISALGEIKQRVSIPWQHEQCQAVQRVANQVVAVTDSAVELYTDNLLTRYPDLSKTNTLQTTVNGTADALWITTSESAVLGSYSTTLHEYSRLPTQL